MSNSRLAEATVGASTRRLVRPSLLLALIHIIALPQPGSGQAAPSGAASERGGYGFFQAGIMGMDLDDVNSSLSAAGFPGLDSTVPTWGGGGYGVVGRFHIGGVGQGGLDPVTSLGSTRVGLKGGYGLARVKYHALTLGELTVLPALGFGGGSVKLSITDPGAPPSGLSNDPTFSEILEAPGRSSELTAPWMFLLNVGVALDYRIVLGTSDDGVARGILVGLEGGYLHTPGETSWTLNDATEVAGGPNLGIDGFYLWIAIGGWGRGGAGA